MDESANFSEKKSKSDQFCDVDDGINLNCNNSLHMACQNGDLKLVEELIQQQDVKLCFGKNRFGMTPLHIAVQNGKIDVINIFSKYYPESVKEVIATTMKTCLDIAMAMKHNKIEVIRQLLIWIVGERNDFEDVEENTTSQFSTSTKLLQTIRELLSSKLEDVNDLNQDVSKGLDISSNEGGVPVKGDTFSSSENMDIGTDMNLQEAEAMIPSDLTPPNIEHSDDYSHEGLYNRSSDKSTDEKHSDDYSHGGLSNKSSDISTVESVFESRNVLPLSLGTLIATMAVIVPSHRDSNIQISFIILISLLILVLVIDIAFHLVKSPQKPRPQISISAPLGSSYMLSLKENTPNEASGVPFKSIPMLSNSSSGKSSVKPIAGFRSGLLLIATLIAIITFQVPFHLLGSISEEGYEQDSIMSKSLLWFSSMAFILSVGVIIHILPEFPLKPWPHILILALFGSYMFVLKAIMPSEATVLFSMSISILLVGFRTKTLWLVKPKSS